MNAYTHAHFGKSADINIRARALRNICTLNLGLFTGQRGDSLLNAAIEDLWVGADDDSPLRATLWWYLHKQKNDVNGERGPVAFPILPDMNNGYECVLLSFAEYFSLMAPVFAAAIKLRDTTAALTGATIYLFPGNDANGRLNPFQRWSADDGRKQLKDLARAALGAHRRLVFHCCRQTLSLRFAQEGRSTHEMGTWGGWLGDDIKNYLKQGDPATMYAIAARRRGWALSAKNVYILPYQGRLSSDHGSGLKGEGLELLAGYFKTVLECFMNKDLDSSLFFSSAPGGAGHTTTLQGFVTRGPRSKRISVPHATAIFDYRPAIELTTMFARMLPPYDRSARRLARELPSMLQGSQELGAAAVRLSRHGEEEEEPPEREDTDAAAAGRYAQRQVLQGMGGALIAGVALAGASPRTAKIVTTIGEALVAGGGGGLPAGAGGAGAPRGGLLFPDAARSAHSDKLLVPQLKDIVKKDWRNVSAVWALWDGRNANYPALKNFRDGQGGWQWNPLHPDEHKPCQEQFSRFQAIVSELLCYVEDYDKADAPVSDPDAAASGTPAAYSPVTQEQWEERVMTMDAARQWAIDQFAQRWAKHNCEAVYKGVTCKQKRTLLGMSQWEQNRNAQRLNHKAFNRKATNARPTATGAVAPKKRPRQDGPGIKAYKAARFTPGAEDIKAAVAMEDFDSAGGFAGGTARGVSGLDGEGEEEEEEEEGGGEDEEASAEPGTGRQPFRGQAATKAAGAAGAAVRKTARGRPAKGFAEPAQTATALRAEKKMERQQNLERVASETTSAAAARLPIHNQRPQGFINVGAGYPAGGRWGRAQAAKRGRSGSSMRSAAGRSGAGWMMPTTTASGTAAELPKGMFEDAAVAAEQAEAAEAAAAARSTRRR